MKIIIIINGVSGVGKDRFVKLIRENVFCIDVHNISTIDKINQIAEVLGWDLVKTKESRSFLAELKSIWVKFNNGPFNYVKNKIKNINDSSLIFVHCREPEEIKKIYDFYNDNECILTLLVRRPKFNIQDNESDKNVEKIKYDIIIENNGSLDYLKKQAIDFGEEMCIHIKQN